MDCGEDDNAHSFDCNIGSKYFVSSISPHSSELTRSRSQLHLQTYRPRLP
jgi:hypothetical protein